MSLTMNCFVAVSIVWWNSTIGPNDVNQPAELCDMDWHSAIYIYLFIFLWINKEFIQYDTIRLKKFLHSMKKKNSFADLNWFELNSTSGMKH